MSATRRASYRSIQPVFAAVSALIASWSFSSCGGVLDADDPYATSLWDVVGLPDGAGAGFTRQEYSERVEQLALDAQKIRQLPFEYAPRIVELTGEELSDYLYPPGDGGGGGSGSYPTREQQLGPRYRSDLARFVWYEVGFLTRAETFRKPPVYVPPPTDDDDDDNDDESDPDRDAAQRGAALIAGLYSSSRKEIIVVSDYEAWNRDSIVVHEFTHALQDQRWGIGEFRGRFQNSMDAQLAAISVIEGDATFVQQLHEYYQHGEVDESGERVGGEFGSVDDYMAWVRQQEVPPIRGRASPYTWLTYGASRLTPINHYALVFPYSAGLNFMAALFSEARNYNPINQLFVIPPRRARDIIFLPKDDTLPVVGEVGAALLGNGYTRTYQNTLGAYLLHGLAMRDTRDVTPVDVQSDLFTAYIDRAEFDVRNFAALEEAALAPANVGVVWSLAAFDTAGARALHAKLAAALPVVYAERGKVKAVGGVSASKRRKWIDPFDDATLIEFEGRPDGDAWNEEIPLSELLPVLIVRDGKFVHLLAHFSEAGLDRLTSALTGGAARSALTSAAGDAGETKGQGEGGREGERQSALTATVQSPLNDVVNLEALRLIERALHEQAAMHGQVHGRGREAVPRVNGRLPLDESIPFPGVLYDDNPQLLYELLRAAR